MKISFSQHQIKKYKLLFLHFFIACGFLSFCLFTPLLRATEYTIEPIQACILPKFFDDSDINRSAYAQCLGWHAAQQNALCMGNYQAITLPAVSDQDEIKLQADHVSFYKEGRSTLSGNVSVQQNERMVTADTAYVYRDNKTNEVNKIELLDNVHYLEPGRLLIARKVIINAQDKSGQAEDVLYRFDSKRHSAVLPSWGWARFIERFANKDYLLQRATYSTCAPQDRAWEIKAEKITIDNAKQIGVARDAKLVIHKVPILYTPYLSFPTAKNRKSGFLMPTKGYTNVGGFDFSLPYYWNIAPNYDATITPHLYTRRGVMMGGQFRYLTENSNGVMNGRFLPHDRAYSEFLTTNALQYPQLIGQPTDRWSLQFFDTTQLARNLNLRVNYQQVSDDYFLQDFSSNLAVLTERQLVRQGELTYSTDRWQFRGLLESYQTLQPVNQTPINDIYQRLPQLAAQGIYDDLPFNGNLNLFGQFDYFDWPNSLSYQPQGPRYYFNPSLVLPQLRPWGYLTPGAEIVQNDYTVHNYFSPAERHFDNTIPRYFVDGGLYFDRPVHWLRQDLTQTLEPRVFYLYVPYHNQTLVPVYDSAYMIFNSDQLFRTNRFSGYDRIGDTNQVSYALTTRWLNDGSGLEKASASIGQIAYFTNRRVQLCQSLTGYCLDNSYYLGFLSPTAKTSPVASRGIYRFNPSWLILGDYVWDTHTRATNNSNLNFRYQPGMNQIINFGYSYLVNGDIVQVAATPVQESPLHQATFSYTWPFTEKWSTLGAVDYNISKHYQMMSLFGVQYDSCCWAVRLTGGRAFKNLNALARPQYNNNIYLQILLKGLGSVGNSDPATTIQTYIPGYMDSFHH